MIKTVLTFILSIGKKGFCEHHGKVNFRKNGFGKRQKPCNQTVLEKSFQPGPWRSRANALVTPFTGKRIPGVIGSKSIS
jgi:hypothetical protein